ncbi:hypothetical protein CHUAL_012809 [Chamberlinius hualienensis]
MPIVGAGVLAGLRASSGCDVPSILYGSTSWPNTRRLRKISAGTTIQIECTFGTHEPFQHIRNIYCADRDGVWAFPDDANFTIHMLNQLCIAPSDDDMNLSSQHFTFNQRHTTSAVATVPMILGSAFVFCLIVVLGMIFRSKLRQRHLPANYLPSELSLAATANGRTGATNSADYELGYPACNRPADGEFWDITNPAAQPYNRHNNMPLHMHCLSPGSGWHDRIYMDQARMLAAYSRNNIECELPSYEEAIRSCVNDVNKEDKKEAETDIKEPGDEQPDENTGKASQ